MNLLELQDIQIKLCADRNYYKGFPDGIFFHLINELETYIEVFDRLILEEKKE